MKFWRLFPALFSVLAVVVTLPVQAQQPVAAPDSGCVEHKGTYTCNWAGARLALERAHSVRVEADPMDRVALHQLDGLVEHLGKQLAAEKDAGQLTLLLIPMEPTGVAFGPMDHDLATLRVYAPAGSQARGTLLWAEVLRGQGDRPWPAQVHALIEQFEARLQAR